MTTKEKFIRLNFGILKIKDWLLVSSVQAEIIKANETHILEVLRLKDNHHMSVYNFGSIGEIEHPHLNILATINYFNDDLIHMRYDLHTKDCHKYLGARECEINDFNIDKIEWV